MTRESWRIAPAESFAEMAQFTESLARLVEQGRQAAVRGYLEARAGSDSRSARRVAAEELIGGECTPGAVQALGVQLAPGYLVLACAVPDPAGIGAGQVAAIGRDIEGIPGALHCGDLSALVVLLPVEDARQPPEATAAELARRLRSLAGQVVYAAQAHRPGLAGIPAALKEARRVLSLVKAIPDAGCRPYRMDDLLVELAIACQPDIRRRLAALLAPLDAGADLRRTLRVLFACDLDRERASRELCINRRTLWYRMDRIRALSGIDPDSAHGIQLLRAALTAARLPALGSPEPEAAAPPSP
jgi:PucR C-terminal helix-turn-helix domain/GGDEF-like domain